MLPRSDTGRRSAEDGISEVVGFVIILAVVIAALSLYLTYAVPVQGREGEIEVMDDVRSRFVDYKTGVDQLWLNSPTAADSETDLFDSTIRQVTLRRVIDPGTDREKGFVGRYMPVLAPIPASAEVSVRNSETFTITGWRDGTETVIWSKTAPALAYTSHNYYWLQQEYYYQLGGVFLRQRDGGGPDTEKVTVIAAPPISIYDISPEEGGTGYQTKVAIVVANMDAQTGGFGATSPIRVETRLDANPAQPDIMGGRTDYAKVRLTFETENANTALAWENMFTGIAFRNGVSNPYSTGRDDNGAWIEITGSGDDMATKDVLLEILVADYDMSLQNLPTMIE